MARILVIDDDSQCRDMLKELLSYNGHEVITASDGDLGLKTFYAEKFDLLICDLIMPKKDGMEVIKEIRKKDPNIKILAISGGDESFPASSYLNASQKLLGANYILDKPFTNDEFIKSVNELVDSNID